AVIMVTGCSSWGRSGDRLQDGGRVLRRRLFPDEVSGLEDDEAAVRESLVQELGVRERNDAVVATVDGGDRCRDARQELGQLRKLLGVGADVAHRLDEAVATGSSARRSSGTAARSMWSACCS